MSMDMAWRSRAMSATVALALGLWLGACDWDGASEESIRAAGTLDAAAVSVRAPRIARVQAVLVDAGDPVFVGDPLVAFDTTGLDLQIEEASAALDAAREQAAAVAAGPRGEELRAATATLALAESQRDRVSRTLTGLRAASPLDVASRAQAASWEMALRQAEESVRAARGRVDALLAAATIEERDEAEAAVMQAESVVDGLVAQRDQMTLVSPIDGVVLARSVEPSEVAQAGAQLLQLAEDDEVRLVVFVPADRIDEVRVGQEADVTVDAYPDDTFRGRVTAIGREAEFTPRNVQTDEQRADLVFRLTLAVANRDGRLRPGMTAEAELRER